MVFFIPAKNGLCSIFHYNGPAGRPGDPVCIEPRSLRCCRESPEGGIPGEVLKVGSIVFDLAFARLQRLCFRSFLESGLGKG
jgi:hypothetical protein